MTTPAAASRPRNLSLLAPLLLPLLGMVWAFWTTLIDLVQTWNSNPQYSHGFLVPGFATFLLWLRRDLLPSEPAALDLRERCLGAALLLGGVAFRLLGAYWFLLTADAISLVPCVAGVVLLVGGKPAWRWAWPAVLFLSFMIPLPYRFAIAMSGPLQRLATITSTFVMQTLGLPALAEGNVILLNEHQIGIVEACSGLRMLVVFFALSTAVVLVIQRHWLDRLLILASAIPIAVASNILRVTATGIMYEMGYSEMASHFFHDVAGWLMMPLALGMLWVELGLLARLFIEVAPVRASNNPTRRTGAVPRPAVPRARRQPPGARTPRERPPVVAEQIDKR